MKRHIPNAISCARLLATPVLLAAALFHHRQLFTWLLLACLLSDILDGFIARLFNLRSRLGATLDSTADMIVLLLSAAGLFVFQRDFLLAHGATLLALVALYVAEVVAALWRYGRISSFHTILIRVAAYVQGVFLISLFLWGYNAWIFRLMVTFSAAALIEELVMLCLLPQYRSDVRGLYWVLPRL
jgi:cardiolipin synthase (CMP-forming)